MDKEEMDTTVNIEKIKDEGIVKHDDSGADPKVLVHLLRMADNYRATNSVNSAIEMYFMLLNDHPETVQAEKSRNNLMEIAENYQNQGLTRQARALYEQLL